MRFRHYGWLITAVCAALALTACNTSKTNKNNNGLFCAPEVESLSLSLGEQVDHFMTALHKYENRRIQLNELRRNANKVVPLCEEFRGYQTQTSCISRDQFNGKELRIERDMYIDECNLAHQYSSNRGSDFPPSGHESNWSDKSLDQFNSGALALSVKDLNTAEEALRRSQAFLNGRLVSPREAQSAAQRGEVTCALSARNRLARNVNLPVISIKDLSERGGQQPRGYQSFNLTAEGQNVRLQLSCQTSGRRGKLTPRDLQNALGSTIEIRHASRR